MGKMVVRCPACNYYYDGGLYSKCPYCKNDSVNTVATIKETPSEYSGKDDEPQKEKSNSRKKRGFWDLFTKRSSVQEEAGEAALSVDDEAEEKSPEAETEIAAAEAENYEPAEEQNNADSTYNNESLPNSDESDESLIDEVNNNEEETQASDLSAAVTAGRFISTSEDMIPARDVREDTMEKQEDEKDAGSLMKDIRSFGLTQGRYISSGSSAPVAPVVGWLVCIKGQEIGKSFNLKKGRNRIGRSVEMDIKLLNESSVSRTCQAVLIYDSKAREYYLLPGESDSLCYLNDKALYERTALEDRDIIEFGDTGKNRYMFVALCNQDFDWNMTMEQE